MTDDDQIRGALTRGEPSFTAHSTLQQLRPTMQQARLRRRVATGAATLALLAGGSAGVLAVATTQNTPTLRTVPGDESEQSAPGHGVDRATADRGPGPLLGACSGRRRSGSRDVRGRTRVRRHRAGGERTAPRRSPRLRPIRPQRRPHLLPPHRRRPHHLRQCFPHLRSRRRSPATVATLWCPSRTARSGSRASPPDRATSRRCRTAGRSRSRSYCAVPTATARSMPSSSRVGWTSRCRTHQPIGESATRRSTSFRSRGSEFGVQVSTSTRIRAGRALPNFALRAARISTMVRNITMLIDASAAIRNT